MGEKGLGSWLRTCKWPHGANLPTLAHPLPDPPGDLRAWLTGHRRILGPLGVAGPRQAHGGAGRKALWRWEKKGRQVEGPSQRGARWRSWRGTPSLQPTLVSTAPAGSRQGTGLHLPGPAQFSSGGNAAEGLIPPAGSGCPSSVAPGAQSVVVAASASPAGGLGDGGASRLWRRAGCGGSGGGTEGGRLGTPAIRRGWALGLATCSGAAGVGAVVRGCATGGGGGIVGRAGAGRLPGKKIRVGWGCLCWGLSPGQRGSRCRP